MKIFSFYRGKQCIYSLLFSHDIKSASGSESDFESEYHADDVIDGDDDERQLHAALHDEQPAHFTVAQYDQ